MRQFRATGACGSPSLSGGGGWGGGHHRGGGGWWGNIQRWPGMYSGGWLGWYGPQFVVAQDPAAQQALQLSRQAIETAQAAQAAEAQPLWIKALNWVKDHPFIAGGAIIVAAMAAQRHGMITNGRRRPTRLKVKLATDAQIAALKQEAANAGDTQMVAVCNRALAGSKSAIRECSEIIDVVHGEWTVPKANGRRRRGRGRRRNGRDTGLLGTAPSLRGILEVIAEFYGGEMKELRPAGEGVWTVHSMVDGRQLSPIVRLKKGRYRFETTK